MMDEKGYERITQILERLASVEGKIDMFIQVNDRVGDTVEKLADRVAKTESAAKSAHKRMDAFDETIRWAVGIGVTLSGIICSILTHFLSK